MVEKRVPDGAPGIQSLATGQGTDIHTQYGRSGNDL